MYSTEYEPFFFAQIPPFFLRDLLYPECLWFFGKPLIFFVVVLFYVIKRINIFTTEIILHRPE